MRWLRDAPPHCRHSIQPPSALRRQSPVRQVEPDGVDYNTPSPIAKSIWDHFDDHIVRAIHIGIEPPTRRGLEQPTLDTLPHVCRLMSQWFTIEEATLARVGLLREDDLYPDQLRLVGHHVDEAGMREEDERLVVALPHWHLLLPAIVLPDHQRPNTALDEVIHDPPAGDMEIAVYLPFPLVRKPVKAMRDVLPFGEQGLKVSASFVVELVQRLERTAINQKEAQSPADLKLPRLSC